MIAAVGCSADSTGWLASMYGCNEAADGGRTRDLKLGKLALYQLSYHRTSADITLAGV
jgi:hypothetical protein